MKRLLTLLLCLSLLILPPAPFGALAEGEAPPEAWLVKLRDSEEPFVRVEAAELGALLAADRVEWYEPDGDAALLEGGEDCWFDPDRKWDLTMIGAGESLARGQTGAGVRVGVIDSGIAPHADFGDRLLPGHNYTPDAQDPDDATDKYGHGTKVAGLIAGAGANGCSGAAPGAELVPLKCTDGKSVKISAICDAIYGGVDDYGCQVLNLSLGVTTQYQTLADAVAYAAERGVVMVSAAGNNGRQTLYYPGAYETVISVASVDSSGTCAASSCHNETVWIAAPGVEVRSTAYTGGYTLGSGTSFATPQVSAACAVLLGADATLTPAGIAECLGATAEDRGAPGWDTHYGCGILRIDLALDALLGPDPGTPCAFSDPDPDSGAARQVQNHTREPLDCLYLLAEYGPGGALASLRTTPLSLAPGETAELELPDGTRPFAQYLLESGTNSPLCEAYRMPTVEVSGNPRFTP